MKRSVCLIILLAGAAGAQPLKRAFTLSDWYRVTTVRQPAMSPDGKSVAFTVTTVREAENKRLSEVWVVASSGGAQSGVVETSILRWVSARLNIIHGIATSQLVRCTKARVSSQNVT